MFKRLSSDDADTMAALHKLCFARPWDRSEMRDLLLRSQAKGYGWKTGSKLRAFVLFTTVSPEADMLTLATHPQHDLP